MRILVLGTGNDIMGDDAVGLVAARELEKRMNGRVDFILTEEAGISLLDHLLGYDRVIVLDSMKSGKPVGEIVEMNLQDLIAGMASRPHRVSLPEISILGQRLGLDMPGEIRVIAMEVEDPYTIREGLTQEARRALPRVVERARRIIESWEVETGADPGSPGRIS